MIQGIELHVITVCLVILAAGPIQDWLLKFAGAREEKKHLERMANLHEDRQRSQQ